MTTSRFLLLALVVAVAAGCATRRPAPVLERQPAPPPPAQVEAAPAEPEKPAPKPVPTHAVKRGETLVGIALQYGLDYRELAAWNNITNVNVISVGQVLALAAPAGGSAAPATTPLGATPLAIAGAPIEARPLSNTDKLKVEPRGQKVPFSERALAQLSAEAPGGAPVGRSRSRRGPRCRRYRYPYPRRRSPRPAPIPRTSTGCGR